MLLLTELRSVACCQRDKKQAFFAGIPVKKRRKKTEGHEVLGFAFSTSCHALY